MPTAGPYWRIPTSHSTRVFYAPSISQGIPPGWRCPPTFHAIGNNPHINPGGYSAAPPNPAYLPPAHYYAYPIPSAAPVPPEAMDNYSPPRPPFTAQTPPSPRQQRIKAYAQQHDEVLCFLRLSPVEFARHTHTLLTNLGYPNTSATPEGTSRRIRKAPWASTTTYGTSSTPWSKKSTLAQTSTPSKTLWILPAPSTCNQEELNAASSILRNLNPMGGLFDQPAAHTLALSAWPRASSVPSAFQTWDQPAAPELRSQ
ncbi:hypothetical protein E4T56_gene6787 [Termitomyces sp. T112]|nr:hypothetical protein E4T56_gene6787 [Termitomyces sp. T112]